MTNHLTIVKTFMVHCLLMHQSLLIGEVSASLPQGHKELTFLYLLNDLITQTMQLRTPSILTTHIALAYGSFHVKSTQSKADPFRF